jgi:hypothetical protein
VVGLIISNYNRAITYFSLPPPCFCFGYHSHTTSNIHISLIIIVEDFIILRDVKHRYSYVAVDYDAELKKHELGEMKQPNPMAIEYPLPGTLH